MSDGGVVNVGVIGVGTIGRDHIRRLTEAPRGVRVLGVSDVDRLRAASVAGELPGARVFESGAELIADPGVDAVLVTSVAATHEPYVLACIAAGKPVFSEKPLASSAAAAERIMAAEVATGRRWVQVGFMRRYDPRYRAMKAALDGGALGAPMLMHAAHRNPSVPGYFTREMVVRDSAVHELDVARWLFAEEIDSITAVRTRQHRRAAPELDDPLVLWVRMSSGLLMDVEVLLNASFGYDIRGEVVCEDGVVELSENAGVVVKSGGRFAGRVPTDWRERFAEAFDLELGDWLASVGAGVAPRGPSCWDGYAAAVACDAGITALTSGRAEPVTLPARPALYD